MPKKSSDKKQTKIEKPSNGKEKKKTLQDFLREVVGTVAGKQAEEIVGLLDTNNYVNEFLIAKKLGVTINQTRNILYKIADHGLVSNIRKKDKKKGWYTYFWKLEPLKALEFLKSNLVKRMQQTESQIKTRESNQFYVCTKCNIELKEENALLYDFTCQECGSVFTLKDNTKLLRELEKNLNSFKNELELVESEIASEREKLDKKREKEIKKINKAKKVKRAKKAAARKAEKNKSVKPTVKKQSKVKKLIKKYTSKKAKPKTKKTVKAKPKKSSKKRK